VNAGSAQPWSVRRRWFLIATFVLCGCQLVGGDGGEAGGDDLPAIDPNVTLGSAALTANCDSSGRARIANLRLQGGYDCDEDFLVSMTSAGGDVGLIRMELRLAEVDSGVEGPVAGPTPDGEPIICEDAGEAPSDGFRLDSVQTEGGSCHLGESTAVCDLERLSPGATVDVNLEICPAPETATVTTEVVLGRLS
jgi:hypothetical protein